MTEIVLRMLSRRLGSSVVLIASVKEGEFIVEESSSGGWLGRSLRPPSAFVADRAACIELGSERLSLGWTQLCGWRPRYIANEHVPTQPLQLIVATADDQPMPQEMAEAAVVIGQLLAKTEVPARVRSASSRMAALIDSLPLPIVFVDSQIIEVFLNEPARRLLNINAGDADEAAVAAAFARLIVSRQKDQQAPLSQQLDAGITFEIENGGRYFQVSSRWIDEDHLTGRLWVFREITDERDAARLKDELVSTVSHELRTPLTSIVGSLGLLRHGVAGVLPGAAGNLVEVAHRNSDRLMRLVNDLLDLDKLQAGELELHKRLVDLAELLREAVEQNEPYAKKYQVTLQLELPSWPISAWIDPDRVLQVIANLVSNAVKFSPSGGVVRLTLGTRGRMLRLSIIDNGPGISLEFRKRLFKRFAQDDTTSQKSGTGLGLAICKGIVAQHGGSIELDTSVTTATVFVVDLPVSASNAIAAIESKV